MGGNSNYAQALEQYKRQGMSEEKAQRKVLLDNLDQVVWAAAGGFVSGVGMGGGKAAMDYAGQRISQGAGVEAQKTASTGEAVSTAVDTDPATHTPEQQAVIEEYQKATDRGILAFIERWRGLKDQDYRKKVRMDIAPVGSRTVQDIKAVIGVDVSDFTGHSLSGNALEHIDLRHGAKGEADHSMADLNDIARMGYVLQHYDSVEALLDKHGKPVLSGEHFNADGSRAPVVQFSKRVDGTYYVVEAVPDAAARKLKVVSAYMQKGSDGTGQELTYHKSGPQPTSKTHLNAHTIATDSIPQTAKDVNARMQELERGIAELDRQRLERGKEGLGTQGRATLAAMYLEGQEAGPYVQGMRELYAAGQNGVAMERVTSEAVQSLNDHQKRAAYEAGRMDARAQVEENKRRASFAKVAGKEKGLVLDSYVEQNVEPKVADRLNEVAKRLNVRVRFVDSILEGLANGQRVEADIRIAKDTEQPIMTVFGHEVGHYLETTAPEAYQAIRQFATQRHGEEINALMELYAQAEQAQDMDGILKEYVNDDIGRMIEAGQVLTEFIEAHRQNRTLLQQVAEALRTLWQKLTGKDRQKVKTAEEALLAALKASEAQAAKLEHAGQVMDFAQESEESKAYSLKQFVDGRRFVEVDADQAQFDGLDENDATKLAVRLIKKQFAGKIIGIDNPAFVNGRTAEEYGHPVKNLSPAIREAKMRAAAELDNLVDAGQNFRTKPDGADGHVHPKTSGDYIYFDTIFKVGREYYSGVVNIEQNLRGRRLKDITKIRNITQDICSSYGENPKSTFLRDASMASILQEATDVNGDFSLKGSEVLTREVEQVMEQSRQEGWSQEQTQEEIRAAVQRVYAGTDLAKDGSVYTYDFLASLPDMQATKLPEVDVLRTREGKVDTRQVVDLGMENARAVGTERDGKHFIRNLYTGKQLLITSDSIRHGLNGNINRLLTNARLGAVIGDVVQNAVPINALQNQTEGITGTYALAGYAADSKGREFVVIVTVEQYDGNVAGMEVYDVTHAVSGRQKRGERVDTKSQGFYPSTNASVISISDFLQIVKETHQSVLSDDVLQHFGEKKNPAGYYTDKAEFSLKGGAALAERTAQLEEQSRQEGWSQEQTQEEIRAAVVHPAFFHVLGLKRMSSGKISSRPKSISRMSTSLAGAEKTA